MIDPSFLGLLKATEKGHVLQLVQLIEHLLRRIELLEAKTQQLGDRDD